MVSGFGDKKEISRDEFRKWLRKPELFSISGMNERERLKFEEELRKTYGYYLEKHEMNKIKRNLESERYKEKDRTKRTKIEKKLKIIKKFLG